MIMKIQCSGGITNHSIQVTIDIKLRNNPKLYSSNQMKMSFPRSFHNISNQMKTSHNSNKPVKMSFHSTNNQRQQHDVILLANIKHLIDWGRLYTTPTNHSREKVIQWKLGGQGGGEVNMIRRTLCSCGQSGGGMVNIRRTLYNCGQCGLL